MRLLKSFAKYDPMSGVFLCLNSLRNITSGLDNEPYRGKCQDKTKDVASRRFRSERSCRSLIILPNSYQLSITLACYECLDERVRKKYIIITWFIPALLRDLLVNICLYLTESIKTACCNVHIKFTLI